jgi:hypothetical protein
MSRFFPVGPLPFGVVARFGSAFFAAILVAVAFFELVFLEVAFLLISAPELAPDRFTRFRARRKRERERSLPRRIEANVERFSAQGVVCEFRRSATARR